MDEFSLELAKGIEELAMDKGMKVRDLIEIVLESFSERRVHEREEG